MKNRKIALIITFIAVFMSVAMLLSFGAFAEGEFAQGDVDGNGSVDQADVERLMNYFAEYNYDTGTSTVEIPGNANMDNNPNITLVDLVLLREFVAANAHEHSWADATCTTPKTCTTCGATEGEANGHNWADADCDTPKTCTACGATEGEANGHAWADADCDTPKTCTACGATEGEANGHAWEDADCDTPKTCTTCGATEGEANGHNWADATCTAPKTCTTCGATEGEANGHNWADATCTAPKTCTTCGATEGEANGHDYKEEITKNPTCTEKGEKTFTCACGDKYTEDVEATGHDYKESVTKNPTCTEKGEKTFTCANDASHTYTEDIDALGHADGDDEDILCDGGCGTTIKVGYFLVTDVTSLGVGDKIIIVDKDSGYALSTNQKTSNRGAVAIPNLAIGNDVQIIELEVGTVDGTFAFNVGNGYLYAGSSSGNHLKTQTTNNANGSWTITIEDGIASIVATASSNRNVMQYNFNNGSPLFACYESASQTALRIYEYVEEYIPAHTCSENAEGATCTKNATCSVCGVEIADSKLPHEYESVVTDPTCTEEGYTTHTCTCGHSYVDNKVDATGHSYDNTTHVCGKCGAKDPDAIDFNFVVPNGVEAVDWAENGVLPVAGAPEGYTFAGWTDAEITTATTEIPTIWEAGEEYSGTETTLYAVYTFEKNSGTSTSYELADGVPTEVVVVIAMKNSSGKIYALPSSNGSSAAPGVVELTVDNNKISGEVADNIKWIITGDSSGYVINPANSASTWLYCTDTNNGVRVGTNANKVFTLDGTYLKHTATGRFLGIYNTQDWRCYSSKTTNIANQTVQFYKKVTIAISETYYVTTVCDHNYESVVTDPDCTNNGYTTHTCSECGDSYVDTIVEATGHSYDEGVRTTEPTCTTAGVKTFTCTREGCGKTKTEVIKALEHNWNEGVETTAPNCTEAGVKTFTCTREECGETKEEEIKALEHNYVDGTCSSCGATESTQPETPAEPQTLATFTLGANGSAVHADGSSKTSYTEKVNGYTLNLTNGSQFYTGARDAKGNSCIKLGSSSAAGKFSFTVGDNVTQVIIYVAKYKANTSKVTINGTTHTLTKSSNDGEYDAIVIDTSETKTINLSTASGGYRCMVNSIEFIGTPNS